MYAFERGNAQRGMVVSDRSVCHQTTGGTRRRHGLHRFRSGIALDHREQYAKRLLHIASSRHASYSGLRLFVNPSFADFSPRNSTQPGVASAASAGPAARVRAAGQQRDTAGVVGGLIEVLRRSLELPIAFVARLPETSQSGGTPATDVMSTMPAASDPEPAQALLFGRDTALADTLARAVGESGVPLLIEDTRTHALVRGVEPVRGVRVLACLAVPVLSPDGDIIAALCALDGVPRWWLDKDVVALSRVADAIGALLSAPAPAAAPTASARPHRHRLDVDVRADRRNSVADTLFDSMREGALLIDRSWTVRWFNSALADLLNVPARSLEQMNARDLLNAHADSVVLAGWQRALDTDTADVAVWHHRATDRWFDAHAWPAANGLAILFRDISATRQSELASERRAEPQLNARSFSAVEQLAGGVAHVFNNLLTIVRANAELMQLSTASDEIDVELQEIQRAATRATDITQQLLAFGQQLLLEPERLSLNHALAALEPTLRTMLPANVRVETSLSNASTTVLMDPAQLREVLLQVVRNARDAMPDGGALSLSTDVHTFDRPHARKPLAIPAGVWVSLTVRDTGIGIAPENSDRVFEPFFTTREVGSGVGLGLSTVFGVIAKSGGLCSLESEPGLGTALSIWLPAIDPAPARQAVRAPTEPDPVR